MRQSLFVLAIELAHLWDPSWGVLHRAELLDEARALASSWGSPWAIATHGRVSAVVAMQEGRLAEAIDALALARDGYPADDELGLGLDVDLADVLRRRWDDGAEGLLARVIERTREARAPGMRELRCRALGVRSQLDSDLGLIDLAVRDNQLELEAARALAAEDDTGAGGFALSAALLRRADLSVVMGRYGEAREACDELHERAAREDFAALALAIRAICSAKQAAERDEDPGGAEEDLLEALASPHQQALVAVRLQLALAWVRARAGRLDGAREALAAARGGLDGSDGANEPERALLASIAADLALRAEAEHEVLLPLRDELEGALTALEGAWSARPLRPGGVGFLHLRSRADVLGALLDLCAELGEPERALARVLEAQALGTFARREELVAPTLAELRAALLAKGEGALVLLPTGDATHVLAVDGETVVHVRAPLARHRLARAAESAAAQGRGADLRRLGELLLPEPVAARVEGWTHVHVSGADLLGLPVERLPLAGAGPTLEEQVPVGHLPSLPVGVWLASLPPRGAVELDHLVVAAPRHAAHPSFPRTAELRLLPKDLELLSAGLPPPRSLVLAGDAAVASALRHPARALTVLTHGVYDDSERRERPAALLLAHDSAGQGPRPPALVRCEDIERMALPELVVLAACGAARGPRRVGDDGVEHLGGACFAAGARAVVLAADDVELGTTLRLLARFREVLAGGATVSQALRTARLESARPELVDSMRVSGLGTLVPFPKRPDGG